MSQINDHTVYSDKNKNISEYYMIGKNKLGFFAILPCISIEPKTIDNWQLKTTLENFQISNLSKKVPGFG